jgi:hypothetical protein
MALYDDFHEDKLPLFSLNFGVITLLPKTKEAIKLQQYRPICLLNVSFKIFTKVDTNLYYSISTVCRRAHRAVLPLPRPRTQTIPPEIAAHPRQSRPRSPPRSRMDAAWSYRPAMPHPPSRPCPR